MTRNQNQPTPDKNTRNGVYGGYGKPTGDNTASDIDSAMDGLDYTKREEPESQEQS